MYYRLATDGHSFIWQVTLCSSSWDGVPGKLCTL